MVEGPRISMSAVRAQYALWKCGSKGRQGRMPSPLLQSDLSHSCELAGFVPCVSQRGRHPSLRGIVRARIPKESGLAPQPCFWRELL